MGLCLAAHTMARSKLQPLPPTDFSLSAVCGTHKKPGSVSEPHAAHGPHDEALQPHATHGPHKALKS
jgi:hypothetical protein